MTKTFRLGALAATATFVSLSGAARADVTPQDVWSQWQSYMASFGYDLSIQPETDGNNLRLPDFTMAMPVPTDPASGQEGGTVRFSVGDIALIDRGDGTVSIEIPAETPFRVTGESLGGENFEVKGTMASSGYSTIASGNPGDITYDYEAAEISVSIDELTNDEGKTVTPGTVEFILAGMAGSSRVDDTSGATRMEQSFTMARMSYVVDVTDPDPAKSGYLKAEGGFEGLTSQAEGTIPQNFDPLAVPQALVDGYAMSATMSYAKGQTNLDFAEDEQTFRYGSASTGGDFSVGIGADGLLYDVESRGIAFNIEGSDIPFPIASTMGAFGLALSVPVLKGDELQDFNAKIKLTDVAVPEPLWMMIDAAGALPHDPLTAEIETSGKARLSVDVFDEKAMTSLAASGEKPGEVTYFSLDSLLLKAGGATIAATGAFDIDNSAQSLINPDLPAFSGKVDLRLTGVTTLLGTLGQMGLIPMPQAMMATGMIQQLGKPESGPDDVSALIEITKDAQLTVNGAPLPLQ
ncbi:DUF2125 domain-containing protein [Pseudooceanicola sp.]|uniref:DUF2125 domain-containing protein n=1 Tax=Pseudooceanicola sp. TaxID=1914328 RepID=UPI0035C6B679